MFELLKNLRPRQIVEADVILEVLDEAMEVIFLTKGSFKIGFEINRQHHFRLKFNTEKKGF